MTDRWRRVCATVVAALVSAGTVEVSAAWTPVGLQGDTVTAIAGGRVFATDLIVAGTAGGGVYVRMDTAALVSMNPPRMGAVRSMYLQGDSLLLMVGADSGLFSYRFTSGVRMQVNARVACLAVQ